MKNNIKTNLNILQLSDIYSLMLFIIYKLQDIPEYAVLSELCYLLDGANLTENADRLVIHLIDQDWLISFLQSPYIQYQIADCTTKVGQPKLAIARIENLLIPLPPLAEQRRIVEALSNVLPYCKCI